MQYAAGHHVTSVENGSISIWEHHGLSYDSSSYHAGDTSVGCVCVLL
jgi:hypothetical protein